MSVSHFERLFFIQRFLKLVVSIEVTIVWGEVFQIFDLISLKNKAAIMKPDLLIDWNQYEISCLTS